MKIFISDSALKEEAAQDSNTFSKWTRVLSVLMKTSTFNASFCRLFRPLRNVSDSSVYRIFEKEGSKVVVDEGSFELIRGATVDFVQEMIRSSFAVVNNPQSESACGCGSSFAVKNFASNPALD